MKGIHDQEIRDVLSKAQEAARKREMKSIRAGNEQKEIPYPFPSPTDWRDHWIYFLLIDRFNNPANPPASERQQPSIPWDHRYDFRQGGNFKGIQQQLDYIASLGAGAIWLSPVLKNSKPEWQWGYHGYATQDFLTVDGRFGSDGTSATAEKELIELIEEAHARDLYIILDIVLNHAARVFDYEYKGNLREDFNDAEIMSIPLGSEPSVDWLNGFGFARTDWRNDLPPVQSLSADDAIWPADLQNKVFFRRRGNKLTDKATAGDFVKGDFGSMRQLVVEYDASPDNQQDLRASYGKTPVLHILITIYQYLVAKFDLDGFRIDTVKYVEPGMIETFGNAIREFALSIGKKNFFTFGEVYDDENTIKHFIGRNGSGEGFGIDAALDFPLFFALPGVAKAKTDIHNIQRVFLDRKKAEEDLLSTHGEAGRYFVTFLDNHDQNERFNHPSTPNEQVLLGIAVQFCLQGIPCLYYGTEQGLDGAKNNFGDPDLNSLESAREALWGKSPVAFDTLNPFYQHIQTLGRLRKSEPALLYGRLYFREVSGNKKDFGLSRGVGGVLAFSRILSNREIVIVANTDPSEPFKGFVVADLDIAKIQKSVKVEYSNRGTTGSGAIEFINAVFYENDNIRSQAMAAVIFIELRPMEVQILFPAQ